MSPTSCKEFTNKSLRSDWPAPAPAPITKSHRQHQRPIVIWPVGSTLFVGLDSGKYWSDRITLKADHRVIQSGPYAFVPHPIYSGILLALLGTVISIGTVQSCIGLAIIFVSFVRKPTLEEQWLCAHLGAAPCEGTHSVRIVTWALQNGIRLRNDRYSSSGASGLRRGRRFLHIAGGYQL
jgi:Isoprenylcysteine carboxyl methyltransferase (ICMT) family